MRFNYFIAFHILTLSCLTLAKSQQLHTNVTLESLTSKQWQNVNQQIISHQYLPRKQLNGSYKSTNIQHGWNIAYGKNGMTSIKSFNDNAYEIGLKLQSIGFNRLSDFLSPKSIKADNEKLTYQWNDNIREIWTNTPDSLEQWFEIKSRPKNILNNEELVLKLQVITDLEISQQDNKLKFSNGITYDKLKIWDAKGQKIAATMHYENNSIHLAIKESQATYPLTIDPSFQHQAYVKASNTDSNDFFGSSVAIDGNYMVIGAPTEDSNAHTVNGDQSDNSRVTAGAAYVFFKTNGIWNQQAYLKPSDNTTRFGHSVDISGNTIAVATLFDDKFYVFVRVGTTWTQQANIANAGTKIAIMGDTIIVGDSQDDSNATGVNGDELNNFANNSGAAYIYTRTGSTWVRQAYLKASNTGEGDAFGSDVDIYGDTVIISASVEDSNATGVNGVNNDSATLSGAAYVFTRTGSTWAQQAYLKASNTDSGDRFGSSCSIYGDTIIIGARYEDSGAKGVNGDENDNSYLNSGAAYIFERSGSSWSQTAYLKASNTGSVDFFGSNVSGSSNTLIISARLENSNAQFLGGNQLNNSMSNSGAAYVFKRNGLNWSQTEYIKASNTDSYDTFGSSLSFDSNTIVIGALFEESNETGVGGNGDNNLAPDSGAVYVYDLSVDSRIGGNVSGLTVNNPLTLQVNGGETITLVENGQFAFPTLLSNTTSYNVTVSVTPSSPSQICSVTGGNSGLNNGTGVINNNPDYSIVVTCTQVFSVLGYLAPFAPGTSITLQNNGGDDISFASGNIVYTFPTQLQNGDTYAVTVSQHPSNPNQFCYAVGGNSGSSDGSGTIMGADDSTTSVVCNYEPIIMVDNYTGSEDSNVTVDNTNDIFKNDTDEENNTLSVVNPGIYTMSGIGGQININADGTFVYTPDADAFGMATIDIDVTDGFSTVSSTINIDIAGINDAPSFIKGNDINTTEDIGLFELASWATQLSAGASNESTQQLNFTLTNDNNSLFTVQPTLVIDSLSQSASLQFETAENANGSATVTVTLHDDGGTSAGGVDTSIQQSFMINVQPVNDAPSFIKGSDINTIEDIGLIGFISWAVQVSAGASNESTQQLSFTLSNDNNALFTMQPTLSLEFQPQFAFLQFETAENANGNATVTVTLQDDGGTSAGGVDTSVQQTFIINVQPVNDAPSFSLPNPIIDVYDEIPANNTLISYANFATNFSFGPSDENTQQVQQFITTITSDNDNVLQTAHMTNNGTLELDYTGNFGTNATVGIRMLDNGGVSNHGENSSQIHEVTISYFDYVFANGFEDGLPLFSHLENLQKTSPFIDVPRYDFASDSIEFMGYKLYLDNDYSSKTIPKVDLWINNIRANKIHTEK